MSLQQPHSSPDTPSAINAGPIQNAQDLLIAFELGQRDFSQAELANADLSGTNLSGVNLQQANLQGANLTATNLQTSDLSGADLRGANLSQTNLQRSNLTRSNLQQAKLDHTNLHGANLSWSNLQNQDLRTAQLVRADLQGANLQQANLTGAALREAKLDAANLQSAIAIEADLSSAYMVYAQLAQADLRKANLANADLTGAILENCKLDQAKLSGARLRHANLQHANLQRAYLRHGKLQQADLTAANLQQADLSHAELRGSILTQADLRGAELEQAKDANLDAIASTPAYQTQCVLHLKLGRTKAGYANFCPSLAFSPDGTMLAYTQAPYTVSLLHLESGEPLQSVNIEPEPLVSVVFSPDGEMLYEMSYMNELKRWNPLTGQLMDDLKEHSAHVTAIALKRNLKLIEMLGVGSPTEKTELDHEKRTFWRYSQEIYTEAQSPDGKLIAKSYAKHPTQRGQIQLLDRQRGKRIRAFDGHQNAVQSLAFHPNSQLLAGKSTDACKLWAVNTGKETACFYPHPPYVFPAIAFVQNTHNAPVLVSSILYQGFSEHRVKFNPSTNTTTWGNGGSSSSNGRAMISANGAVLARHIDGQLVQLWNIKTGRELGAVNAHPSDHCVLLAISSTGEMIATLNRSTVSVWDVSTQSLIQSIEASGKYGINAAFSPCGERLAIGGMSGIVKLWNWRTGETVEFSGYCGVEAIAFSPHNPTPILTAGYNDGTIKFWNLQTRQEDLSFVAHEEAINTMAFSPNGKWLASSSRKNGVRLWHLR